MTRILVLAGAMLITLTGTQMAAFGIANVVYAHSGSASLYALTIVATTIPYVLASMPAGVFVDRVGAKTALLLSQVCGCVLSLCCAGLCVVMPDRPLWLVIPAALGAAVTALDFPAVSVMSTQLLPADKLARANGLLQFSMAAAQVSAPLLSSQLLVADGLSTVYFVDASSAAIAIAALATLPGLRATASDTERHEGAPSPVSFKQAQLAIEVVAREPVLLRLLTLTATTNISMGVVQVGAATLMLTLHDVKALGIVTTVGGCGMIVGSLGLVGLGAPRRPEPLLTGIAISQGLLIAAVPLYPAVHVVAAASAALFGSIAIWNGISQSIWQMRVPVAQQGRVFALRAMLARVTIPIASGVAGLAIDGTSRLMSGTTLAGGPAAAAAASRVLTIAGAATATLALSVSMISDARQRASQQVESAGKGSK